MDASNGEPRSMIQFVNVVSIPLGTLKKYLTVDVSKFCVVGKASGGQPASMALLSPKSQEILTDCLT